MYNRYIPNGTSYTRIPMEDEETRREPVPALAPEEKPRQENQPEPERRREEPQAQAARPGPAGGNSAPSGLGALSSLLEQNPLGQLFRKGGDSGGMGGILKALHLEDLDSGDILLLLILLFLFLEGDNTELVITLGLILLLGLGDSKKDDQPT